MAVLASVRFFLEVPHPTSSPSGTDGDRKFWVPSIKNLEKKPWQVKLNFFIVLIQDLSNLDSSWRVTFCFLTGNKLTFWTILYNFSSIWTISDGHSFQNGRQLPNLSYISPILIPPCHTQIQLTLTLLRGWWGRCEKTISRRRKEGRVEKKSACSAPAGPRARTQDLPRARRGSPAARQGGCLDKQAFPCL